jgi:hypothetical protein
LIVTDYDSRASWSFRFGKDGSLIDGEPFYHLEIPDEFAQGPLRSGARGATFDDQGYAYFATAMGVQICDQPGRVVAIIRKPASGEITDGDICAARALCREPVPFCRNLSFERGLAPVTPNRAQRK